MIFLYFLTTEKEVFYMLTDTSLGIITFINLLFIPFISLRIYCKRNSINWKLDFELFYRYILFCIFNLPLTRITCSILEKLTGVVCLADSSKYTIIGKITAIMLPFLCEIAEHYIKINVTIEYNKKDKTSKNKE